MIIRNILSLYLLISSFTSIAQIHPAERDTLNYRLTGFTIPENKNTAYYRLEVASGQINNNTDFNKKVLLAKQYDSNFMLATLPEFGKEYTWRVSFVSNKNKIKGSTPLYHFTVGNPPITDTSKYRLRILRKADHHENMLVFLDYSKGLYDMEGNLLWYLPDIPGVIEKDMTVRDLKPTPFGTLTFITVKNIYEVDYDGNILWEGPRSNFIKKFDSLEMYHHEFTRLNNGHYMAATNKSEFIELGIDSNEAVQKVVPMLRFIDDKPYRRVIMGGLIELDEHGNALWEWNSSPYIATDTLFVKKVPKHPDEMGPHLNSFYFDESNKIIYMSFKNANHILKVAYPSGEVLARYNGLSDDPPVFCGQHAVHLNNTGNVILFNNNHKAYHYNNQEHVSSLVELATSGNNIKKVWEFPLDIDTATAPSGPAGGSMLQLPDGCYIGCGGTTGRSVIVSSDKRLIWNALMEKKDEFQQAWRPMEEYKNSFISDSTALKNLVFRLSTNTN